MKYKMIKMFVAVATLCLSSQVASAKNNILMLKLKNGDVFIQLDETKAPNHVARIKKLTQEGAYDNVVFHRVIEGFMAQTGDVKYGKKDGKDYNPALVGLGGSKYPNLQAEFSKTPFLRGVVGMARSADLSSANSQFFICLKDSQFLNKQYTVVGKVIKGMDVVDKIKTGDVSKNGAVVDPDVIIKATIE